MTYLAERFDEGKPAFSSQHIAEARGLSQPLVAKVLTQLSVAGLVTGSKGPSGGYKLARKPSRIRLYDIVVVFEKMSKELACPMGPNWCGVKDPCPVHDALADLDARVTDFLKNTTLGEFQTSAS